MGFTTTEKLRGKFRAAQTLGSFIRYLQNWSDVWRQYRAGHSISSPLHLRNGLTIEFGEDDDPIQLFQEIVVRSCYTPKWFYSPASGDHVIDLGANIGMFALSVAWMAEGLECHCFEPAPATRAQLIQNINTNGLAKRVWAHSEAIGSITGAAVLKKGASSVHRSMYDNVMTTSARGDIVQRVSLQEAIFTADTTKVDLLKVDIEGSELEAFAACSFEALAPVQRVVLEYHDHFRAGARGVVEEALKRAGMTIVANRPADALSGLLYAVRI